MKISDLSLIILISLLIGILWNASVSYSEKEDLIRSLKSQLNNSQEKVMALELNEKRLDSEIEEKNTQLEDMKNWIGDSLKK